VWSLNIFFCSFPLSASLERTNGKNDVAVIEAKLKQQQFIENEELQAIASRRQ
jgi:hypothetical protein